MSPRNSQTNSDWIATSLLTARALAAGADCLPCPYVDGLFKMVVIVLESIENLRRNRDQLKELCETILEIMAIVRDQLSSHEDPSASKFQGLCGELESSLQDIMEVVTSLQTEAKGFRGRFQGLLRSSSTTDEINKYQTKVRELRLNFMLAATMDTNLHVHKLLTAASPDTSTTDTIESGLRNIAVSKNIGKTSHEALKWLGSMHQEWLLFFDNADNPSINLNHYFPCCNHGNILITSRNPGLRVYAGSHCLVSDMEESDAVELLFKSSAETPTSQKKQIAVKIVKELSYLPLAIIQAGAFISKSGALGSYLALYASNRTRLLTEKPAQLHDDYTWTVYTTWQISFDQLSRPAATLLQLCSFLHHRGISEQIFSNASGYKFRNLGPSREDLKTSLDFLAQFLGPTGSWDSMRFTDVTNELQAYSLINFDSEMELFSIHPLVHQWSQSILTDQRSLQASTVALVGMSVAQLPREHKELASIRLLPHIDSLLQKQTTITPDFNLEYGEIYYYSGRPKRAKDFQIAVLEQFKAHLGEDHLDTLGVMENLALTYFKLGNLKEAQEFQVHVLEKRKNYLGPNHPNTLYSMGNLALTHHHLGEFYAAKELETVVLERCRQFLGENHPETLLVMGNLGRTYHMLGFLKEATELQISVWDKQKSLLGNCHPHTMMAAYQLAMNYQMLGEMNKATEIQEVQLETRKCILGDDHPDTLFEMNNLAWSYYNLGQLKEAEEIQLQALEKFKHILGDNHLATLDLTGNLASNYRQQGRMREAYSLDVLVLNQRKDLLGEDHPHTLRAMNELALTYHALGRLTEAQQLQVSVQQKRSEILGKDHPGTLNTMGELALSYRDLGQFKEAEELEVMVLKARRRVLGDDHPLTLYAMGNLAMTYNKQAKFRDAEILEVELLEKHRTLLGDDHPATLLCNQNLAWTYRRLGQLRKAEELIGILEKRRDLVGDGNLDILVHVAVTYR